MDMNKLVEMEIPDMLGFPHQKPPGSEASLMELPGRAGTNVGALVTGARRMDFWGKKMLKWGNIRM